MISLISVCVYLNILLNRVDDSLLDWNEWYFKMNASSWETLMGDGCDKAEWVELVISKMIVSDTLGRAQWANS